MREFLQVLLGGLVSSGMLMTAAVFVFKLCFEKLLDKQVEAFKGELMRDLEYLRNELGKDLDLARSGLRMDEATKDARFRSLLEFRAKQLSDFYWPLYFGLQKDNAIWRRILDKRDATDDLRKKVGAAIEKDVVMPNHEKMVTLIEANLYLAEANDKLEAEILQFIRYVSVNKCIHAVGDEDAYPAQLGEKWPSGLIPQIEQKTKELQAEFDALVKHQNAQMEIRGDDPA